jgi:hypothetical protein
MVAARPGVSCSVTVGTAAVPAPTLVKLTEPVTLEPTGALAGKFRHPSVAPYIRAMQRQVDQIEALLG